MHWQSKPFSYCCNFVDDRRLRTPSICGSARCVQKLISVMVFCITDNSIYRFPFDFIERRKTRNITRVDSSNDTTDKHRHIAVVNVFEPRPTTIFGSSVFHYCCPLSLGLNSTRATIAPIAVVIGTRVQLLLLSQKSSP